MISDEIRLLCRWTSRRSQVLWTPKCQCVIFLKGNAIHINNQRAYLACKQGTLAYTDLWRHYSFERRLKGLMGPFSLKSALVVGVQSGHQETNVGQNRHFGECVFLILLERFMFILLFIGIERGCRFRTKKLDDEVKLWVAPCGSSEKNCWGWEGVSIFRSACADRKKL